MQYPRMGQTRQYRVTVPELSGGINYSVSPHKIDDNQLSDASNVWYRNGSLKTRPALSGEDIIVYEEPTTCVCGSVGSFGYVVGSSERRKFVTLVDEFGKKFNHKRNNRGKNVYNMMLASSNGALNDEVSSKDIIVFMHGDSADDTGVFGLTDDNDDWTRLKPYVPTVLINGRAQVEAVRTVNGDACEPYNMISDEYKATFTSGGDGLYYFLPTTNDDIIEIVCKFTGRAGYVEMTHTLHYDGDTGLYIDNSHDNIQGYGVAYNKLNGCLHFYEIPTIASIFPNPLVAVTLAEGVDNNIVVKVKRSENSYKKSKSTILGMKFSTWYGGGSAGLTGGTRLFVSGNPDHPNLVHWSSLNNPLYFPEGNYAYVGEDTSAVTAFGKQSDMLVIFKENALFYSTYMHGSTVTADQIESQEVVDIEAAQAVFPMMQIHPYIGCDCPDTIQLCNNRLVWLNSDGNVYGLFSSGVYNERNLRRLSLQLGDCLRRFGKDVLKKASATRHEEQYLLLVGNHTVYAMDFSSYGFNYYSSYSTDENAQNAVAWHRWEFGVPIISLLRVRDTAVAVGEVSSSLRHTYLFIDDASCDDLPVDGGFSSSGVITSRFRTKLFDFGNSERFKRVNSMYLQITGEIGKNAFLTYHDGKHSHKNADAVVFFEEEPESAVPQLIRPNAIRTRLFGFEVNSECRIDVGDIIINYSTMGAIK